MTEQYLAGELSWLLSRLQAAATDELTGEVVGLRRQAETLPIDTLWSVALRALRLSDVMCWDALTRGDTAAFTRQATTGAELFEFGVCSGLLDQD